MLLTFLDKIKGKDTDFMAKIQQGLENYGFFTSREIISYCLDNGGYMDHRYMMLPKIHTIREDSNDRWKKGMLIHAVVGKRFAKKRRIAPPFQCTGIQEIELNFDKDYSLIHVSIDNRVLYYPCAEDNPRIRHQQKFWLIDFVNNDGFDNVGDFECFFETRLKERKSLTFKGKIIHWTDNRY